MNRSFLSRRGIFTGAVAVALAGMAMALSLEAVGTPVRERGFVVDWYAVTDLEDDRRLVGISDDVFLGRVDEVAGTGMRGRVPETQYRVTVIRAVKGSLADSVVVNQQGGRLDDGTSVAMENDTLLETGRTYLFATRRNPARGYHTLVPGYGDLPADSAAVQAQLVARFTSAFAAQIPYNPREVVPARP